MSPPDVLEGALEPRDFLEQPFAIGAGEPGAPLRKLPGRELHRLQGLPETAGLTAPAAGWT